MDLRSNYLVVCYTDACTSKIYKSFENMMMPKAGDEVQQITSPEETVSPGWGSSAYTMSPRRSAACLQLMYEK